MFSISGLICLTSALDADRFYEAIILVNTKEHSCKVKLWNDKMNIGSLLFIHGTFCGTHQQLRINVQSFTELVLDADVEVKLTLSVSIHGTQTTAGVIETNSYDALAKTQAHWSVKYTVIAPLATPTRLGGLSATGVLVDISDGPFVVQLLNYSYCDLGLSRK